MTVTSGGTKVIITLFANNLGKPNSRFLIWNSDKSLRKFWFHAFKGVTSPRLYWTGHFLGFVTSGSIRSFHKVSA